MRYGIIFKNKGDIDLEKLNKETLFEAARAQ
jgi:hypothetical protein